MSEPLFDPPGERIYFGEHGEAVSLDGVPLLPNHADADSYDCEPQALATIYLDSERGHYFYILPGSEGS